VDTTTKSRYRTIRIPFRDSEGNVIEYLESPDKSDPVFKADMQVHWDRLNAALDDMAKQLGISREELEDRLTHD